MTTIKATCPACGDVDLAPRQVSVTVNEPYGEARYTFTCPSCRDAVRKQADDDVVALLASAGVRVWHEHVPAEALEHHAGPPLCYDDVLDFALWLERTADPFAALTRV